jgi:acetoacetyl-CoA synthetase
MELFRQQISRAYAPLSDSVALHGWSVSAPQAFWDEVFRRAVSHGVRGSGPALQGDGAQGLQHANFFPTAKLNYAENLLAGGQRPGAGSTAIIYRTEAGTRRELSWHQLRDQVARLARRFASAGVEPAETVACWLPNCPETVVSMLAANALGAVFSSTSPDFGVDGVVDRFAQIAPKVLVVADGYRYGGREHRRLHLLPELLANLPSVELVIVVPELDADSHPGSGAEVTLLESTAADQVAVEAWASALATAEVADLSFHRQGFDEPGFVLFSSGTTGLPKCIVHRAAGLLLKHWTEHVLHSDIRAGDRVFYFTTCGWMMWNWLVGSLAVGATIVLYDGSPFAPTSDVLWDLAQEEEVAFFGVGAKYLDACRSQGLRPIESHRLPALRTIASTGSPLSAECFSYVYDSVADDIHLASISGGTDICGCFVLGDPTRAVFPGEIQGPALGLAVDVATADGQSLAGQPGRQGELVCRNAFPSMPLGFLGDSAGSRFEAAYFSGVPGVWTQGDFAEWTEHGGVIILGRSDATLNSGGVRIGTAEIYRQVEALPEVLESLAIGQVDGADTRIVLFVRLAPGAQLDDALTSRIKTRLRTHASPRHVPAEILAVADLPRTRSGKLAELAVADVVNGRPVRNSAALANPESLEVFRGILTNS